MSLEHPPEECSKASEGLKKSVNLDFPLLGIGDLPAKTLKVGAKVQPTINPAART